MSALRVATESLFQNFVGSLMAVVCTPVLDRVGDTVRHTISCSHDGRMKVRKTQYRRTRFAIDGAEEGTIEYGECRYRPLQAVWHYLTIPPCYSAFTCRLHDATCAGHAAEVEVEAEGQRKQVDALETAVQSRPKRRLQALLHQTRLRFELHTTPPL
jgi:hypothetical protein